MPRRLGLAVLGSALLAAGWTAGARGEPMPPDLAVPPPVPALGDVNSLAPEPAAAENPSKTNSAPPGETFPYRAAIAAEPTSVRSGPGDEFYETGRLRRGDEVEVYRHDPRGWCAVRPPPGSFSYVSAEHLKPLEDGLAETTVAGVKSFVGSTVGGHRDRSHISLRRGEQVELLEKPPAEGLCKITPPPGEFRWVHEKCLERLGPFAEGGHRSAGVIVQGGSEERPSPAEKWRAAPRTTAFQGPDANPTDSARNEMPPGNGGSGQWFAGSQSPASQSPASQSPAPGPRQTRRPTLPQRGWIRPSSSAAEDNDEPGREPVPPPPPAPADKAEEMAPTGLQRGDQLMGATLDEIDLELAKIVCQPKNRWALDQVRNVTKDVLRNAEAPADRGRARRLLDRIAQFEEVRRQALGLPATVIDERSFKVATTTAPPRPVPDQRLGAATPAGDQQSSSTSSTAPAAAGPATPIAETSVSPLPPNWEDPRFDGSGRLVPLEKRGDGDPQFLLVDDQGSARYFVTAAPGVNLRAYRDRLVGITGSRVEDSGRGKPHLTAQRVTLLPDAPAKR